VILPEIHTGRFCCNCTHLLGVRNNTFSVDKWRCNHDANINKKEYDLVTGQLVTKHIIESLYDLRIGDEACGVTGNWYEEYVKPDFTEQVSKIVGATNTAPRKQSLRNVTADDL